jgi:hypothetical protein
MPILLPVSELEKGMRVAESFVHRGRTMIARQKTLNEADLDILRRKFPNALVKIVDPILDELVEFEDTTRNWDVARRAQSRISECMADVGRKLSPRSAMSGREYAMAQTAVLDIMRYLAENPVTAALLSRSLESGQYLSDHAAAVFYLAMTLGSSVRSYVFRERSRQTSMKAVRTHSLMDMLPLGLGAMFIDLGLFPLARQLDDADYGLTDEDRRILRDHPEIGAEMLPESFPTAGRVVVRTHHENMTGSGYPNGMEGGKLHIFSRIVRICDAYASATSSRFSEARTPAKALWEMTMGPMARYYDRALLKVFAGLIQPFPIGAKVQLSDGRFGVVVRYNRRDPFQPDVIIAFNHWGDRLPKDELEGPLPITGQNGLRLAGFDDEDLSFIYSIDLYSDPPQNQPNCESVFGSVYP